MVRSTIVTGALAAVLALTLAACGSGGKAAGEEPASAAPASTQAAATAASSEPAPAAAGEISPDQATLTALVLSWYRDADPVVCERMTDRFLEFGWQQTGDQGRQACRQGVGDAEPVQDVVVATPEIVEDSATLEVSYTLDGQQQVDSLRFIRGDTGWLVDHATRVD